MNYRTAQVLSPIDVTTAGTKVIDIDVTKPISRLMLRWRTTKAIDYLAQGIPADIIKIELVDGSKRLYSVSGHECQALAYYNHPFCQFDNGNMLTACYTEAFFPLDFGRFLWDEQLAFDPTKFINPQLRITHNESLSDTSCTENLMEVTADLFDEKVISPIGFLSAIEHYNYAPSAADAYNEIYLPDDRQIRQLLVRGYTADYEPWYSIDEMRLDENLLEHVIYDELDLELYTNRMRATWGNLIYKGVLNSITSERVFYVPMTGYFPTLALTGHGTAGNLTITIDDLRGGKIGCTSSATGEFGFIAMGFLPWHTYQFPTGNPMDIEDWWDPSGKKPRLRLRASTSGNSGVGQVILEQLYRY